MKIIRTATALLFTGALILIMTSGEAYGASHCTSSPTVRRHPSHHSSGYHPHHRHSSSLSSRHHSYHRRPSSLFSKYHHRTELVWVPGYYQYQQQRVVIKEGYFLLKKIPAVYETRKQPDGKEILVQIEPERTEKVWVPEETEIRQVKVWIPGYYTQRTSRVCSRSSKGISFGIFF